MLHGCTIAPFMGGAARLIGRHCERLLYMLSGPRDGGMGLREVSVMAGRHDVVGGCGRDVQRVSARSGLPSEE